MKAPEPYLVWKEPRPPAEPGAPSALNRPGVQRWLRCAALATLLLVALPPLPYLVDPLWLVSLVTGYAAAALIVVVMLLPLRRVAQWPPVRISVERHRQLSEWALGLSAIHAIVLLVGDTLTLEYLWPSQPRYMLTGNLGLIVLAFLVFSSLERFRVRFFGTHKRYRPIHVGAAAALVVLVAAHMVGSGIFLSHPLKAVLVALVAAASVALALRRPKERQALDAGGRAAGKQPV